MIGRRCAVVLAAALLLSGCASGGILAGGDPSGAPVPTPGSADQPYDGPLIVQDLEPGHPQAGAAGDIVDCDTWGGGGAFTGDIYGDGATTDHPEQALYEEGIFFGGAVEGLRVAKVEPDRVLYVLEVGGVYKEAVIVHNGPATEGAGGPGWYVESWAVCNAAELPRSYTDSIGLQIWTDESGTPVPTDRIEAWRGPEHCSWQTMIFLEVYGHGTYVRDPLAELADYFRDSFQAHAELPRDAVDTGYRRGGQTLWLSGDESLAFVGTADDVEVWPREIKPLGCD